MMRSYRRLKGARTELTKLKMHEIAVVVDQAMSSLKREMDDLEKWLIETNKQNN
jgi:hypothetical protein